MIRSTSFLVSLAVILGVLGCGPGAPKSGTVVQKWYEEATTRTWTHWHDQCVARDEDGWCTTNIQIPHEHTDYDDEDWKVKLEECKYDDSGNRKCRAGTREIPQADWEQLEVGDFYGDRNYN